MWKIQVQPIQLRVVCLQLVNTIYNLQNRQIIIIDSQQKLMQNAVNHKSTINNNSKKNTRNYSQVYDKLVYVKLQSPLEGKASTRTTLSYIKQLCDNIHMVFN